MKLVILNERVENFNYIFCIMIERLNVNFVSRTNVGVLTKEEKQLIKDAQDKHRTLLRIPRRYVKVQIRDYFVLLLNALVQTFMEGKQ